jgi:hypothetical protein
MMLSVIARRPSHHTSATTSDADHGSTARSHHRGAAPSPVAQRPWPGPPGWVIPPRSPCQPISRNRYVRRLTAHINSRCLRVHYRQCLHRLLLSVTHQSGQPICLAGLDSHNPIQREAPYAHQSILLSPARANLANGHLRHHRRRRLHCM